MGIRKEPPAHRFAPSAHTESPNPGLSPALGLSLRIALCGKGALEFRLEPLLGVEGEESVRSSGCPWHPALVVLWDISAPLTLRELRLLSRNHYFLAEC